MRNANIRRDGASGQSQSRQCRSLAKQRDCGNSRTHRTANERLIEGHKGGARWSTAQVQGVSKLNSVSRQCKSGCDRWFILSVHVFEAKQLDECIADSDLAAAACFGLSPVSSRTTTLVSTAVMTSHYLASNRITHLRRRLRFAFGPQTAGDLVEISFREAVRGTQQNSIAGFFDGELRARRPGSGSSYVLGEDDLALSGEPSGFHR